MPQDPINMFLIHAVSTLVVTVALAGGVTVACFGAVRVWVTSEPFTGFVMVAGGLVAVGVIAQYKDALASLLAVLLRAAA